MIWGERANPYKHSYLEGLQRIEVSVRQYLDWRKNSLNISRFLSCVALCMCLRLDHSCFILGHLICGKCAYYYVCTCVQGGASYQIFGGPDRKIITIIVMQAFFLGDFMEAKWGSCLRRVECFANPLSYFGHILELFLKIKAFLQNSLWMEQKTIINHNFLPKN